MDSMWALFGSPMALSIVDNSMKPGSLGVVARDGIGTRTAVDPT